MLSGCGCDAAARSPFPHQPHPHHPPFTPRWTCSRRAWPVEPSSMLSFFNINPTLFTPCHPQVDVLTQSMAWMEARTQLNEEHIRGLEVKLNAILEALGVKTGQGQAVGQMGGGQMGQGQGGQMMGQGGGQMMGQGQMGVMQGGGLMGQVVGQGGRGGVAAEGGASLQLGVGGAGGVAGVAPAK